MNPLNATDRYSDAELKQALQLGTSTLFEASGITTSAVDTAIRPVWNGAAVAGPAFPLHCAPGDNLAIHVAMELVPRGSILVVSTDSFIAGYWGEVLTVAAEAAGVRGLIIDGGVRDIAALAMRRFPVFSRGISMRGTGKASVPSVGQPLSFTGTPVALGDLVVADDDGVLILPAAEAQQVLARGQIRAEKEASMMSALQNGASTLDLMGLSQWSQR
ncbi:dimethylmenaquinone methyltransferase [Pokkaliibacter plantistimulans]|uniref:Dimethylmenaquinone methyltransferase n=1 Tax=Proteobacteria bacterium 228 TaxID=2083153 RepID=A0A2S5KN54_9PROT|nr:dimethylmenaquinone methyltransferase [Pokkaliibacter plantistimulans]PPC76170.1 dimethylmenaquinone methyltransferase [Pokkaliibacter plantistimulans]